MADNKRTSRPRSGRNTKKTPKINMVRYFQVLGISLSVLLIGTLAAVGLFKFEEMGMRSTTATPDSTAKVEGDKINVLLMCTDEKGLLTDSIMLASYDMSDNKLNMLSIPRDTRIYVGNRYQKINAAHAYVDSSGKPAGAQGTVEAVTRLTGIPINYYVDFTFDSIARCVDALGTVEFEIPDLYNDGVGMVYDDPEQDLHIYLRPGLQELDGEQVVHLLRYRKGNPDASGHRDTYLRGDLDRIEVQKNFIKAFIDQKLNAGLVLKIPSLFKELSTGFETNFTAADVIRYRSCLSGFSTENLQAFTVPGTDEYVKEGSYDVSYFIPNLDELRTIIQEKFGYPANEITTDKEYKKPDSTPAPTEKPKESPKPEESSDNGKAESEASSGTSSGSNTQKRAEEQPERGNASESAQSGGEAHSGTAAGSSASSGGASSGAQQNNDAAAESAQHSASSSGASQNNSSSSVTQQQEPPAKTPVKTETPMKKSEE